MENLVLNVSSGKSITNVILEAHQVAKGTNRIVEFTFNKIKVLVSQRCNLEATLEAYFNAHIMGWHTIGYGHEKVITKELRYEINEKKRIREVERLEQALARAKQVGYIVE